MENIIEIPNIVGTIQKFQSINGFIEINDLVVLDWDGKGKTSDLRYGNVIKKGEGFIWITNQYGNESHADIKTFPNYTVKKVIEI